MNSILPIQWERVFTLRFCSFVIFNYNFSPKTRAKNANSIFLAKKFHYALFKNNLFFCRFNKLWSNKKPKPQSKLIRKWKRERCSGKKPHGAKNDLTSMKLTKAAEVPARHFISNVYEFLFISQFRLAGIFFHHKIETLSKPWISYFKSFGWFKFLILYT